MSNNIELEPNYAIFRDCFSSSILKGSALNPKTPQGRTRRNAKRKGRSPEKVGLSSIGDENVESTSDFLEFLASETFATLPQELKTLSYSAAQKDPDLLNKYTDSKITSVEVISILIPPSVLESLTTYSLLPSTTDATDFLKRVITDYIEATVLPPPIWSNTRAAACEICSRDWVPLTYHHLIPKQMHAKAIKRGWHEEWHLNSVAWLCRACHSFIHGIATNEELARNFWTVEMLLDRKDVQSWATWVGRIRWKSK